MRRFKLGKKWMELIDEPLPPSEVTENSRRHAVASSKSHGAVRYNRGRFYTKKEWEKYRQEVLSKPLK